MPYAFGCSNWRTLRIAADQMMGSLAAIDPGAVADKTTPPMDQDLLRYHHDSGLPAIPFSSQAGGLFSKLDQAARGGPPADVPPMYDLPENRAPGGVS